MKERSLYLENETLDLGENTHVFAEELKLVFQEMLTLLYLRDPVVQIHFQFSPLLLPCSSSSSSLSLSLSLSLSIEWLRSLSAEQSEREGGSEKGPRETEENSEEPKQTHLPIFGTSLFSFFSNRNDKISNVEITLLWPLVP